jgi:hypothetical protein
MGSHASITPVGLAIVYNHNPKTISSNDAVLHLHITHLR